MVGWVDFRYHKLATLQPQKYVYVAAKSLKKPHSFSIVTARQITTWRVKPLSIKKLNYFFFFRIMGRQFNLLAKQFSIFIKHVLCVPVRFYFFSNMRYFIDFSYLKLINLVVYVVYYHLKILLLLVYFLYQVNKFTYRITKWCTITSSFFLILRRCFRQRLYMAYNLYTAFKRTTYKFLTKPLVLHSPRCYLRVLYQRCSVYFY
jgi:hypothetical protein